MTNLLTDLQQTPEYDTGAAAEEPAERLLWIYYVLAKWERDPKPDCDICAGTAIYPLGHSHEGDRCHCARNSVGSTRSFKEPRDFDAMLKECDMDWALNSGKKPEKPEDVRNFSVEVRLTHRETWSLDWFQHHQPDWGETDKEVLDSFQRYVWRIQRYNERWMHEHGTRDEPICLMGAEDRWRWCDGDDNRDKPCRCDGCKKFGVVRIAH